MVRTCEVEMSSSSRFRELKRGDRRSGFNERRRKKGSWRGGGGQRSNREVVEHVANSNATQETSDIPGFYYDVERKRYFRVPLSGDQNLKITSDQFTKKECRKLATVPNCNSLIKMVDDRRYGHTSSDAFRRSLNRRRLEKMKLIREFRVPHIESDDDCVECVQLLSGADNTVFGVWRGKSSIVIRCNPYERNFLLFCDRILPPWSTVTDIVRQEHVRDRNNFVYSSYGSDRFSGIVTSDSQDGVSIWQLDSYKIIFSIACNPKNNTVAFGGENQIGLKSNACLPIIDKATNGENIHSLSYDEDGMCLVAGSHRGTILYYDTRQMNNPVFKVGVINCTPRVALPSSCVSARDHPDSCAEKNIQRANLPIQIRTGRRLLCHILKLGTNRDPYVVCSGYDDYLALIDTRMRREVLRYSEHVNSDQKVRFNVDSRLELLCSSGQDGRTRTWNLKNGELIRCIEPPNRYDRRSGNLHSILLQPPHCNVYDPDVVIVYKDDVFVYRSF